MQFYYVLCRKTNKNRNVLSSQYLQRDTPLIQMTNRLLQKGFKKSLCQTVWPVSVFPAENERKHTEDIVY